MKFHIGMAWMPRMLSNLHHSCHNNDLNRGVWISSCLFLYKFKASFLEKKNATPVTSEPLISWWWPLLVTPTLPPKYSIRQRSKSIAAAQRNPKDVRFLEGVNLTRSQEKQNSHFLYMRSFWSTFPAGQVGGFIGSVLLSRRWETMCFIPLHCKSNLMLHALQKGSRKREWMRWHGAMLTQIPQSLRQHQPLGSLGVKLRDSEQLTNQSRGWLGPV